MTAHTKKKLFRLACSRQKRKGLVNDANGNWTTGATMSLSAKQMVISGVTRVK